MSNSTTIVVIDGGQIRDWDSFHDVFAREFGFPRLYGRNMDAWIDCMTRLDRPEDGMSTVTCRPGEVVTIQLDGAKDLRTNFHEIYDSLVDSAAFVNWRRIDCGQGPVVALSFCV